MTDDGDMIRQRLAKLDEIERHAQALVDSPHYHLHDGKPVCDPDTGDPLRDAEPVLTGLDTMLRASELRARILGLYAPQRHHLVDEAGNTIDISRLMPLLARLGIVSPDGG